MRNLIANWNLIMPSTFDYAHLNSIEQEAITKSINAFYFGNDILPETLDPVKLTQVLIYFKIIQTLP